MRFAVTPYAGVWIEIVRYTARLMYSMVTPYAGVWIEIWILSNMSLEKWVTPYAGVWIEIDKICVYAHLSKSLPTRECGLK